MMRTKIAGLIILTCAIGIQLSPVGCLLSKLLFGINGDYNRIDGWIRHKAPREALDQQVQALRDQFAADEKSMPPDQQIAWRQLIDLTSATGCGSDRMNLIAKAALEAGLDLDVAEPKEKVEVGSRGYHVRNIIENYAKQWGSECSHKYLKEFQFKSKNFISDFDKLDRIFTRLLVEYNKMFTPFEADNKQSKIAFRSVRDGDPNTFVDALFEALRGSEDTKSLRKKKSDPNASEQQYEDFFKAFGARCTSIAETFGTLMDNIAYVRRAVDSDTLKKLNTAAIFKGWVSVQFCRNYLQRDKAKTIQATIEYFDKESPLNLD